MRLRLWCYATAFGRFLNDEEQFLVFVVFVSLGFVVAKREGVFHTLQNAMFLC